MMRTEPPPTRRRATVLCATFALATITAACGGGSKSSSAEPGASNAAPEEFGLSLAQLATRIEQTEQLVATCMTTAGFQYVAVDFVSVKQAMDSDQTAPGVPSDDYVKQYGLGITTQLDKPIVTFGAGPENTTHLDALPPTNQVAYRRALWGETPEWNHARALEEEDFSETGGCLRSSAEQTYTATELGGSYVNPGDKLIEQDPRMIAAIGKWSDCMRADGYEYGQPDQVDDDLRERLDAIAQNQDPRTLTGTALNALQALQGEELAIATLLTTCEEDHIEPVQAQIESELYGSPQQ